MGKQFAAYYGSDIRDINAWQALCVALDVDPVPDTITQCKRVCIHSSPLLRVKGFKPLLF